MMMIKNKITSNIVGLHFWDVTFQKQATMQDVDEDMVAGGSSRKPRNPRVKQPSDQLRPWIVRALEKVFCMGTTLHKENYAAYEERHAAWL